MAISKIENNSLASGVPSTAKLPAGTVLQVVNSTLTGQVSFTTSTYADLGLSATITPFASSNKILIIVTMMNTWKTAANTYYGGQIQRNGTAIQQVQSGLYSNNSLERQDASNVFTVYDSPSTTSPVTYKVQLRNEANLGVININGGGYGTSTITLMEIAA